jgi:hypothetical protein
MSDTKSQAEYVEISNPAFTMSRDAPATVWVPKSSVESGPPRGNEAVKIAYKSLKGGETSSASPHNISPLPVATLSSAAVTQSIPVNMRNRVAVIETGHDQLAIVFKEKLRILPRSPVITIAPEVAAESLKSRDERAAYAVKAWQDSGTNVSLFVSAPDGLAFGRSLSVEMYDGMGAGLISKIETVIPTYGAKDSAGLDAAVVSSIALLAERARDANALLSWYARIVAVEGNKVYINAGRESGITIGQRLKVIRGGKVVQGLGFAPGNAVGTLEVSGFVGSNGATAIVSGGVQVYTTDIVVFTTM